MEKEFISYEEALALKELGFDEQCFATYNSDKKVNRNPSHNMEDLPIEGQPYYWNNSKIYKSCITTPLYQQAFRWFRDKYGIDSYVEKMIGGGSGISEVYIGVIQKLSLNTDDFSWETPSVYDTYEEAELECLKKLIEIVKNK